MAFLDKLGQAANKVGAVAGEGLELGKAKSKIVLEKGKIKDGYEALGEYIYTAKKSGAEIQDIKLEELIAAIDEHVKNIEALEAQAKEAGAEISGEFKKSEQE